jgi:hypothetical protein
MHGQLRELLEQHKIGPTHPEYFRRQCLLVFAGIVAPGSPGAGELGAYLKRFLRLRPDSPRRRDALHALSILCPGKYARVQPSLPESVVAI